MSDDRTVNVRQAMALAGVSRRTIYNWLKAGKLTWTRTAGGRVRIVASSLFVGAPSNTAHSWKPDAQKPGA